MNDKVFLDTNILVYAHTDINEPKQSAAQALIRDNVSFISTQVLQELAQTLSRKFAHSWPDIQSVLTESAKNSSLITNNEETILTACSLAGRYKYSFYDSLIISAALQCDCTVLYSEDLHSGQLIEKRLRIINPFESLSKVP